MKQITVNLSKFKLREFLQYSEENIDKIGLTYGVLLSENLGKSPDIDDEINSIDDYINALDNKLLYVPFAYTPEPDEMPISCLNDEIIDFNYDDDDIDVGDFEFSMTSEAAFLLKKENDNLIINSADSCADMFGGVRIIKNGGILDKIMEKYIQSYIA